MLDGFDRDAHVLSRAPSLAPRSTLGGLELWLRWSGGAASLARFVKPRAVLEQFTLTQAARCDDDPTLWRCAFAHVGRSITIEPQILSLLRRLSPAAPWVRAERTDAPVALDSDPHELNWDDFARRALP